MKKAALLVSTLEKRHIAALAAILAAFILTIILITPFGGRVDQKLLTYQSHYHAYPLSVQAPIGVSGPTLAGPETRPAATTAHVNYHWLQPVMDQGQVGQCQCYAFALQYDYLYGTINHQIGNWSCRLWYPEATQGHDQGSYFEQYPPLLQDIGAIPTATYGWPGSPDADAPYPVPQWVVDTAAAHRYSVQIHVLQAQQGGGQVLVNRMEHAIATGHPINIDVPVYASGGMYTPDAHIDLPASGDALVGYHAMTGIRYDRLLTWDGVQGWFIVQNQWTDQWGIGRDGLAHPYSSHLDGYALMSYRYVAQYAFGVEVLHGNGTKPQAPRPSLKWLQPSPYRGQTLPLPSALRHEITPLPRLMPALASSYVAHIPAADTGVDLAPSLNYWAHRYNLSVAGLLATIGTECGLYTTSTRCDHVAGGLDISFGDCQVTVATAGQFGIGNGVYDGYVGGNGGFVRTYENNPSNCHSLGTRVLAYFRGVIRGNGCDLDFPSLYVAWNAGPNNPCAFLLNPSGQAYTNYQNYLWWYRWALGKVVGYDPYAQPPIFHLKVWNEYRARHHERLVSPYVHGKLSWAASVWRYHQHLLGITRPERYIRASRPYRVDTFERGAIYCWNAYHRCKIIDP